jgi:hypothetical protein
MTTENSTDSTDCAPIVFDSDGTPMKVRVVGGECEGDVSGEGHYAYQKKTDDADEPTVWFEEVDQE